MQPESTLSLISTFIELVVRYSYAMGDDFSSSSMTNAIRLVPGQSLFYLRLQKLFGLEEGYNTLFGNEAAVGAN